jgi:hypothetical protein
LEADKVASLAALRDVWDKDFDPAVAECRGRIVKMMGDGCIGTRRIKVECPISITECLFDGCLPVARRLLRDGATFREAKNRCDWMGCDDGDPAAPAGL